LAYGDDREWRERVKALAEFPRVEAQALAIADAWGLSLRAMFMWRNGPARWARGALTIWLHDEEGWSYPQIGSLLHQDHSTVLASASLMRSPGRAPTMRDVRAKVLR
jgi:hypothetical protein